MLFKLLDQNKEKLLGNIAEANGWKLEDVVAIYLVIGNDLFFLADVLRGKKIIFSKKRALCDLDKVTQIEVKEVKESEVKQYTTDKTYVINGIDYEIKRPPEKVFGRYYIVLRRKK